MIRTEPAPVARERARRLSHWFLPLIKVLSFAQKVPHLNPVGGKNMNRFYPGRPDGTQTERLSWAIAKGEVHRAR